MADWNLPTLSSLYTDFLSYLHDKFDDQALMFDGTGTTNVTTGTIGVNSTSGYFTKYNGATWPELSLDYARKSAASNFTILPTYNSNNFLYNNGPAGNLTGTLNIAENLTIGQTNYANTEVEIGYIAGTAFSAIITFYSGSSLGVWDSRIVSTGGGGGDGNGTLSFFGTQFNFEDSYIYGQFTSTANVNALQLKPSDYGTGKPALSVVKTSTANKWNLALYDGTDDSGTINIGADNFTHLDSQVLTLASGGNITTAPTINSETILHLGNVPVDAKLSAENASAVTGISTGSTIITLDLGTVSVGDMFLVGGAAALEKSTTGGRTYLFIAKESGAGNGVFEHDGSGGRVADRYQNASTTEYFCNSGIPFEVTISGTLVIGLYAVSDGSNGSVATGEGTITAIQIYNA